MDGQGRSSLILVGWRTLDASIIVRGGKIRIACILFYPEMGACFLTRYPQSPQRRSRR